MILNVDLSRENKWETFIDTKYGIFYTLDISNIGIQDGRHSPLPHIQLVLLSQLLYVIEHMFSVSSNPLNVKL